MGPPASALEVAREEARVEALAAIQGAARGGATFTQRESTKRSKVVSNTVHGEETLETSWTRVQLPDWRAAAS